MLTESGKQEIPEVATETGKPTNSGSAELPKVVEGEPCPTCGKRIGRRTAIAQRKVRSRNGKGDAEAEVVDAAVGGEESARAVQVDACDHQWGAPVFVKAMGRMKRACTKCGETELV